MLRDAFRSIRSTPLLTSAAVLSFALGIGANTAIFTLLDSLLLKPLPVRAPEELIALVTPGNPTEAMPVSYPVFREIRARRLLNRPFAWATDRLSLTDTGEIRFVDAIWATGNFFDALGVGAVRGRTFGPRDDRRDGGDAGPVAVLSYGTWQRQFGGASDMVGRHLTIERVAFTIVGVAPADFLGLNVGTTFDVILPLEVEPRLGRPVQRLEAATWTWLQVMARRTSSDPPLDALARGVAAARTDIRAATMPAFPRAEDRERYLSAAWDLQSSPGGVSRMRRQYGGALWVLLAVVAVVLLIACANVATLLLERTAARRFEFSVRLSLGATRSSLVRQLLCETLLMALGAALAGLLLARWSSSALVAQLSTWAYTATFDLSFDWRMLVATTLITTLVALVAGTAPALRASRSRAVDALALRSRGATGGRTSGSGLLVVAQVALSLVLVVAAGLFLKSFVALAYRDLGFDRDRVLIAVVDAGRSTTPPATRLALFERLRQAVSALPDVEAAATSTATPLGSAGMRFTPAVIVPGHAMPADGVRILTNPVSSNWFKTFGTRLLAGRDVDGRDRAGSAPIVLVNEAFAARYFAGRNAVGQTITEIVSATERRSVEIVGLVQNAAFVSVRDPIEPTMYAPLEQRLTPDLMSFMTGLTISVRSRPGSPSTTRRAIAAAITAVDPSVAISFQTVSEQLNVFYIRERLLAWLSGFFGAFALVLAALGLYASISHHVVRRRSEIGIRMAIGAQPGAVRRMVLARVTRRVLAGVVIGGVGSWWAASLIGSLLYDVPARDPATFAVASLVMLAAAGVAAWLPARRAAQVDPVAVMREG